MMQSVRRYCKCCQKETLHDVRREFEGGEKIIYWVFVKPFTLGMADNDIEYICQVCA